MGSCDTMLKYVVFLFNFVFFLTGVALIGIGAYIQVNMQKYLDFLGSTYLNTSILLIIVGAVILVVTFFGCCGSCTENHCMLYTYGTLLSIILLVSIGLAITVYIFKDKVKAKVEDAMTNGLEHYNMENYEGVTDTWNIIQFDFNCCGVQAYTDWKDTDFGGSGNVPDSCCLEEMTECGKGVGNLPESEAKNKIHTRGCFATFETTVQENVAIVAGIGAGVVVLLLIGVVIACCLARNMKERRNYV